MTAGMLHGLERLCVNPRKPAMVGHRGYSEKFRENSRDAIVEAVVEGADLIEIDVQLTFDGKLVCYHDRTLGYVKEPVGLIPSSAIESFGVPLLNDVLEEIKNSDVGIVLDCKKPNWCRPDEYVEAFMQACRIHHLTGTYSNSVNVLRALREACPDAVLLKGTMTASVLGKWPELVDGYMAGGGAVDEEGISRAHEAGKFVLTHRCGWDKIYLDWRAFYNFCAELGADGVLCGDVTV